jgi:hypothetical protein
MSSTVEKPTARTYCPHISPELRQMCGDRIKCGHCDATPTTFDYSAPPEVRPVRINTFCRNVRDTIANDFARVYVWFFVTE